MKDLFLSKNNKEYQKSFGEYVLSYKKVLENFNEYLNDLYKD